MGRLRRYDTDDRASTFAYDGTKRLGDDDAEGALPLSKHPDTSDILKKAKRITKLQPKPEQGI